MECLNLKENQWGNIKNCFEQEKSRQYHEFPYCDNCRKVQQKPQESRYDQLLETWPAHKFIRKKR